MYEMKIRVRYSEVDRTGKVNLHQLLEYLQDCVTFHSIAVGLGIQGDEKENRAWYLIAWDICIHRYPQMAEYLTITTEPYKMRGFYGYRRFQILDEQGEVIVEADSNWIFMNTEHMIPVKIPKELAERYITAPVKDQTVRVKRKLPSEGEWTERESMTVTKLFLDSNGHVNNTYYALWAEEVLPENEKIKEIKIDYRQSAFLGDTISISTVKEKDGWRVRFLNQDEKLIALVSCISAFEPEPAAQ